MSFFKAYYIFLIFLVLLPIVFSFIFVYYNGVNVITVDEDYFTNLVYKAYKSQLGAQELLKPHNEHIIFFPAVFKIGLAFLTKYNTKVEMYFILFILLLCLLIIFIYLKKNFSLKYSLVILALISFLIFNIRQYENMLWGYQITFLFPFLFGLLSLFLLFKTNEFIEKSNNKTKFNFNIKDERVCKVDKLKINSGKKLLLLNPSIFFLFSLISAIICSFSSAHGLLIWFAGLFQILFFNLKKRKKIPYIAIWLIFGTAAVILYFIILNANINQFSFLDNFDFKIFLKYFITLIGFSLFTNQNIAFIFGITFLVLFIFLFIFIIWQKNIYKNSFILSVALFYILMLLQVALARHNPAGENVAKILHIHNRYNTIGLFFLAGLILILANILFNFEIKSKPKKAIFISFILTFILPVLTIYPFTYIEGIKRGSQNFVELTDWAYKINTYKSQQNLPAKFFLAAKKLDEIKFNVFANSNKNFEFAILEEQANNYNLKIKIDDLFIDNVKVYLKKDNNYFLLPKEIFFVLKNNFKINFNGEIYSETDIFYLKNSPCIFSNEKKNKIYFEIDNKIFEGLFLNLKNSANKFLKTNINDKEKNNFKCSISAEGLKKKTNSLNILIPLYPLNNYGNNNFKIFKGKIFSNNKKNYYKINLFNFEIASFKDYKLIFFEPKKIKLQNIDKKVSLFSFPIEIKSDTNYIIGAIINTNDVVEKLPIFFDFYGNGYDNKEQEITIYPTELSANEYNYICFKINSGKVPKDEEIFFRIFTYALGAYDFKDIFILEKN